MKTAPLLDQMLASAFMENLPDHVYFKDRDLRFLAVSQSLAQSHNCSVEELLGTISFESKDPKRAQEIREAQWEVMRTGVPIVDRQVKRIGTDGRILWTLSSCLPLRNSDAEIVGVFGTSKDITAAKLMEQQLEKANQDLREASRLAGMAQAATEVVHNVGNVLNGVNVSSNLLAQGLRNLKVDQLGKLCALLQEHSDDLGAFMTQNAQGRHVVGFLQALHTDLSASQAQMLEEVLSLETCVGHIKEIVSIQQSYATMKGLVEDIAVEEIVEDALKMSQGSLQHHHVQLRRKFAAVPKIKGERGKILQILNNLLRNAKNALDDSSTSGKAIEIEIAAVAPDRVRISISDNGIGILPENLTRIFAQGFTTRKEGHGFGLHSAANAAKEMHGALTAYSEGSAMGALFVLELPASGATDGKRSDRDLPSPNAVDPNAAAQS